jgi:co-chaperonin GroES (HSP10)
MEWSASRVGRQGVYIPAFHKDSERQGTQCAVTMGKKNKNLGPDRVKMTIEYSN